MPIQRVLPLAAAFAIATAALAAEPGGTTIIPTQPVAEECAPIDVVIEPLPLGAGLRAFIDPTTGRLREPTSAELAAIASSSRISNNQSIEGLVVEVREDGMKLIDLQGRFMHTLIATRNAEGVTTFKCTPDDPHVHPHEAPPAAPAGPAEK